jgi:ribosomal protein S12
MRTQVNTTKEKTKANNQQKLGKDPMQRGLVVTKMIIEDNKKDLR